jgi:hypothetical protein
MWQQEVSTQMHTEKLQDIKAVLDELKALSDEYQHSGDGPLNVNGSGTQTNNIHTGGFFAQQQTFNYDGGTS